MGVLSSALSADLRASALHRAGATEPAARRDSTDCQPGRRAEASPSYSALGAGWLRPTWPTLIAARP